jgi:hypothetical protein
MPSSSATEMMRQPSFSELLRYLALQGIQRGAMAAGTPREASDLGAYGIQAGVNRVNQLLGRPQDTRNFYQQSGVLPTTAEAQQWLLKRLNPYLPADTGWKPPIEQETGLGPRPRGILPEGWNPFIPRGVMAPTDDRGVLNAGPQ